MTPPPDFRRILTAMPRSPSWTEPGESARRETVERGEASAARVREERPRSLTLPSGTAETLASDSRSQFPEANRGAFDAWLGAYRNSADSTVDGLGYHQQALGLTYLMSHDAVASGNAEDAVRRIRQFNEELTRYTADAAASPLSNEEKLGEIYGVILQPAMALSGQIASSELSGNEAVQAALRELTANIALGFERMVALSTGENLEFFREFSQAQVDLMRLFSRETPASPGETLRSSRQIVARLDRAVELSRGVTAVADTPLADFIAIVQNYAPLQRSGIEPPTDSQIARGMITGNTLVMVSTLASEIDLAHRTSEPVVNERYFRFNQAMEALLARNPQMNFQEAFQALRDLQWNERIYDRIAGSDVPVERALQIFSGSVSDDAVRTRLRDLIRRPGETLPSDTEIAAALRGTPRLRELVPALLSNLIHYLEQAPEDDANRRWIVDYFRSRDPETDVNLIQRELLTALQLHQEPSQAVRDAVRELGEPGRVLVNSIVDGLRQEAQAHEPPQEAEIPAWLTRLAEGSFERPARDSLREVREALSDLSRRLAGGERLREGQNLTYDALVNILVNARDHDAAHMNDLLTVSGTLDDDHEVLTQLIDLDRNALEGNLGASAYVHRWADGVLSRIERHSYNYAEAFVHDEENHPASFRVIAHLIGGGEPTSLGGQLSALTDARLGDRLTRRAQQVEANAHSTLHGIGTAMASWENIAFTGMMFGSSQAMTRAITSTETVASGARISLGNILPRFITRSPFVTAALTSVSVGMGYALANEQYNQVHHRPSQFGSDFLVSTLGTMAILSPLWIPSWITRVRTLPQIVVNHPILSSAGGGAAYAGFMRLSDPESNLPQDFAIGTGATMTFLAPAWAPRIPVAGSWIVRGSRTTGGLFNRLGTVAEGGQLGLAGHGLVAGGTGVVVGGMGAALQAGRDSAGGYETHFWQDLRGSTVAMGVGLTASSVLAAAVRRPLMNLVNRRLRTALTAESTTAVALTRGRMAETGLAAGSTLLSATIATGGMLVGTSVSRAWANGHPLPYGEDLHFSGEELGVTFLNMLAFEMLNNAANRLMLRSSLGRVRATQVDYLVERLTRGVETPAGENRDTMRNFLWNRLALEMLRGTNLSPLSDPEVIQNWQASFREIQSGASPEAGSGRFSGLRGFANRLIAGAGRLDIDSTITRSRPGLLSREGSYGLDLTRRVESAAETELPIRDSIGLEAVRAMIAGGRQIPPPQEVFMDREGRIHLTRPEGDAEILAVPVEFSANRIYLSPRTRRSLQRFFSRDGEAGELRLRESGILSLHGEAVFIHPLALAYTQFLAQVRRERPRADVSFVITRANPNGTEFAPNLIFADSAFEVYSGPLDAVPAGRRGHVLGDILIPRSPRRGAAPEPTFRVRIGEGHWDRLPLTLRNLFSNLPRSEGIAPTLSVSQNGEGVTVHFQSFFVGENQSLEASQFEGRVELPDDFRIDLLRTAEGGWRLTNRSTGGTTLRVGDQTLRNRDFAALSHDAEIVVNVEGGEPVTLRFRLPGGPEGGSGGSGPTAPPSTTPPPTTPPTAPPVDPSSTGAEGSGNPPVETAPSASQPSNSEGTNLSLPAVDPAIMARIQSNIRRVLVGRAQSQVHRDSPTAGVLLENSLEVFVTLDLNTGELVDRFDGGDLLRVGVRAQVDANRILLAPEVRQELDRALAERDLNPSQRAAIEAVRNLHGQPIVPSSEGTAGVALPSPTGEATLLPSVSPEHVETMRQDLIRLMTSESGRSVGLGMTVLFSGSLSWELDPFGVYIGTVTLDLEGNITATHLARPDFMSPRGTTYRAGVVGGGLQVPVLINERGTLLSYEMPEGANARQTSAMMAYENSPQNLAGRTLALSENPYTVDMILRRGPGNLLHDLNSILTQIEGHSAGPTPPVPRRVSLWRIDGDYLFASRGSEAEQSLQEGGYFTRVGELEVRFRPRARDDSSSVGRFSFRVLEGELPPEVQRLLEFVQGRVEGELPGIAIDPASLSEETEAPLASEPTRMGPAPTAPAESTASAEPDTTRILSFYYQDPEGRSHPVSLTLNLNSDGNWVGALGRRHFPFLEGSERGISRQHLQVTISSEGEISWRELPSASTFRRSSVLAIQTGATIPRADFVLRLAREAPPEAPPQAPPAASAPPTAPPSLPPQFTRMVLRPGERRLLAPLLGIGSPDFLPHHGLSRGAEPDSHAFWLLSLPGSEISLTREYGDTPGRPQRFESGHPLLLGELGEQVWLQVGGEGRQNFPIFLDDAVGSGSRLPRVTLEYHGQEIPFRFRSSSPRLLFGRDHSPQLFTGVHRWISGHHFTISVAEQGGVRGYRVNVHGRFGLYIGGIHIPQGQAVFLPPGYHEFHPIVRTLSTAEGNAGAPELDRPIRAALPPIDVWLPAWSGSPPAPPAAAGRSDATARIETSRPPAPPPSSGGVWEWFRNLFR